ncbi:hypothetical protein HK102_010024, partial [Quaeritorhiza haematococci]
MSNSRSFELFSSSELSSFMGGDTLTTSNQSTSSYNRPSRTNGLPAAPASKSTGGSSESLNTSGDDPRRNPSVNGVSRSSVTKPAPPSKESSFSRTPDRPLSPQQPIHVKDPNMAMNFEKLLASQETKKLTSTPDRLKSIEVKKDKVIKLEAKAPTAETEENTLAMFGRSRSSMLDLDDDDDLGAPKVRKQETLWEFLKNTGPDDPYGRQSGNKALPTPPNRGMAVSTASPSRAKSVDAINDSPIRASPSSRSFPAGSGSDKRPALVAKGGRSYEEDLDDEDDELFGNPRKKNEMSLADFLRSTEPPADFNSEPTTPTTKQKKTSGRGLNNLFGLNRSKDLPPSPTSSTTPPRAGQGKALPKFQMIHIPYESASVPSSVPNSPPPTPPPNRRATRTLSEPDMAPPNPPMQRSRSNSSNSGASLPESGPYVPSQDAPPVPRMPEKYEQRGRTAEQGRASPPVPRSRSQHSDIAAASSPSSP